MSQENKPIRINQQNFTIHGMVADLTGLVRDYRDPKKPLAQRRVDLHDAWRLGSRIIGIASQRPWREHALQDVLQALRIQDRHMHTRVTSILAHAKEKQGQEEDNTPENISPVKDKPSVIRPRIEVFKSPVAQNIEEHQELQNRLRDAFHKGEIEEIWNVSGQLYRLGHQMLAIVDRDSTQYAVLHHELKKIKIENPDMHQRVSITLNEVQASRIAHEKKTIPQQQLLSVREIEVYRYENVPEKVAA